MGSLDRFILHVANAITLLFGLLAFIVLFAGIGRAVAGEGGLADFALAGALIVVPYCFAGTLHRIVSLGRRPSD